MSKSDTYPTKAQTTPIEGHDLVGKVVEVKYVEMTVDTSDQSTTVGSTQSFEMEVGQVYKHEIVGTDDQGRDVCVNTSNMTAINARPADRDAGAFSIRVGHRRSISL